MIRASDSVARVLSRDERLLEVFTRASPRFARLRNPSLRRVMSRLVTVEQAARIAGVDAPRLVARLNEALHRLAAGQQPALDTPLEEGSEMKPLEHLPTAFGHLPEEQIVEVDVRDHLRRGVEPFSRIMAAKRALLPDQVLRLRTIFEPVPLYQVMKKQGLDHWTERLGHDDWRVWFYPPSFADPDSAPARALETSHAPLEPPRPAAPQVQEEVSILDVRGLEPPEPMVLTLAALERLRPGGTLVQINERVPRFLLPRLEELGYDFTVVEQEDGPVRLFIRRA